MEILYRWITDPLIGKFITAFIGLVLISVIIHLLRRMVTRNFDDSAIRYRVRKMITLVGYFVSLLMISLVFRNRLGALTIYLGFASAGLALALQEVVVSVAGWLSITWGGLYRVGDRIQSAGIKGDVIDISILRTTLMEIGEWVEADLYTGRIVRVANNFVFKEPVYNYSADFPYVWDQITVPIRYGSDYTQARKILTTVTEEMVKEYTESAQNAWETMLRRYAIERATIQPVVTLVANDNWVEFTVRYIVDFKKRRSTRDQLFTRILEEFAKTDGQVTFASATYEIVGAPKLDVDITQH